METELKEKLKAVIDDKVRNAKRAADDYARREVSEHPGFNLSETELIFDATMYAYLTGSLQSILNSIGDTIDMVEACNG